MYADRDLGHEDQGQIEREIRSGLPLGSSASRVEAFLGEKGIEHSFESSSNTEYAVVRKIRGSNMLITKSLGLQLHFDNSLKLESIETKVHLTGP